MPRYYFKDLKEGEWFKCKGDHLPFGYPDEKEFTLDVARNRNFNLLRAGHYYQVRIGANNAPISFLYLDNMYTLDRCKDSFKDRLMLKVMSNLDVCVGVTNESPK